MSLATRRPRSSSPGSPFFLQFNPNAVHGPLQAKPEDLAQFPTLTGTEQKRAAMMLASIARWARSSIRSQRPANSITR